MVEMYSSFDIEKAIQQAGDMPVLLEIIDIFLSEYQSIMGQIEKAILTNNLGEVKMLAHKLRGILAVFGAEQGSLAARELEHRADAQQSENIISIFGELQQQVGGLVSDFYSIKNKNLIT